MRYLSVKLVKSVAWNVFLIAAGSFIFSLGVKTVAFPHEFVSGGLFGTALLLTYVIDFLEPNVFYILLNIPLFIVGYVFVSKRFFLYSLLGVVLTTIFFEVISYEIPVENDFYAALIAGALTGTGAGLTLRSLGSGGGLDIIAVIINREWGIPFGKFSFGFHLVLFSFCFLFLPVDKCITSLIMIFVAAKVLDEVLAMFSKRKVVRVLSEHNKAIAAAVNTRMNRGSTFLKAYGAYSGADRDILMTVINNIELKRLENIVFEHDPDAIFIVENTFSVLGRTFSQRKNY